MRFGHLTSMLAALLLGFGAATAQEMSEEDYLAVLEAELPGTLMNNPIAPDWYVAGEDYDKRVITDPDVAGQQAVRLKIKRAKPNAWDVSMIARMDKGASSGDAILVAVWVRTEKPAKDSETGTVQVRLQQSAAPYTGLAEGMITPGEDWELWYLRGIAAEDYDADELTLAFNAASAAQTVEIAQFYVMNLGPDVDVGSLPVGLAQD